LAQQVNSGTLQSALGYQMNVSRETSSERNVPQWYPSAETWNPRPSQPRKL